MKMRVSRSRSFAMRSATGRFMIGAQSGSMNNAQ
jgi:hypothetical protein